MKKLLYTFFFVAFSHTGFAQEDQPGEVRLREKMIEYIQQRLGLNRAEAERFQPVFINYFKDLKRTNRDYRGQGLELQQKLLDVRLRYRDQFKPIIGEKRSNEVFEHEKEFIKTIREEIRDRREERLERRADKRKKTELLLQN